MKVPQSLRDLIEGAEALVYIEDLSGRKGLLQAINPVAKLVAIAAMITAALCISDLTYLLAICIVPIALSAASRIPLRQLFTRTALIPAFMGLISLPTLFLTSGNPILATNFAGINLIITSEGVISFLVFTVRIWFCVASLSLLILSTGFEKTLKLLASIKVPTLIIQLFSLTYRYFFVSLHETQSVLIGKEARTYVHKKNFNLQALRDLGSVLSSLFIRTYERSERVYLAMKARGFEINDDTRLVIPKMHVWDVAFASSLIVTFVYLALL